MLTVLSMINAKKKRGEEGVVRDCEEVTWFRGIQEGVSEEVTF